MSDSGPQSAGLFESFGKLLGSVLSTLQTRAELIAVEFHEEKYRLVDLFLLTGLVIFLGAVAFLLLVAAIFFQISVEYRGLVAAVLGVIFLGGSVLSAHQLKKRLKNRAFAETVNQIKKDLECLTPPQ